MLNVMKCDVSYGFSLIKKWTHWGSKPETLRMVLLNRKVRFWVNHPIKRTVSGVSEGFHGIPGGFQEYFRRFGNEGALAWFQKDSRNGSERFRGRSRESRDPKLRGFKETFRGFIKLSKEFRGFQKGFNILLEIF